jgi:hypothetical protein
MAFVDTIDLQYIKSFLGINEDDDSFDDEITTVIPFYVTRVSKLLQIDYTKLTAIFTVDDLTFIAQCISAMIGCHLLKSDEMFGSKYSGWKVGNVQKQFLRRVKDYDNWCDMMDDLMAELGALYSDQSGNKQSGKRRSITDDYTQPFVYP